MIGAGPIVIVGGGPTGLGAAWRLHELGYEDWQLLEAAPSVGGLASSIVDDRGFTWDLGGHVMFSHYEYFDGVMNTLLGAEWIEHEREAWVWMRDRFIPYPLQDHFWQLPPEDVQRCLDGLRAISGVQESRERPTTFEQWICASFGAGLADVFLLPYNRKVWGFDPAKLDARWIGDRVAAAGPQALLDAASARRTRRAWGPNARFRYPKRGGTGAIWAAARNQLPRDRVQCDRQVAGISVSERVVRLAGGDKVPFRHVISTMPLDRLVQSIADRRDLLAYADQFLRSHTHVVGVGLEGPIPAALRTKNWIYFPEPSVPFHRVTVFSNYSPHHVPEPTRQWSLLCETTETQEKTVRHETVAADTVQGLRDCGFLNGDSAIASIWHRRLDYGYPTPFLGRDALLATIDARLRRDGILSRGRFGAWKYEVSNQDHSFMQGVEAVDHLLTGSEETTYHHPDRVNAARR